MDNFKYHFIVEYYWVESFMCLLTAKHREICGGDVLKKFMKEIWTRSSDPHDV